MEETKQIFIKTWSTYLRTYCRTISPDVAEYIACQFALESNFGNSKLAKEQNNITGMRRPLVRPTCSLDTQTHFATYQNQSFGVLDFLLCLSFHKLQAYNLDTIKHYKAATEKWYCPERDYHTKIQFIYSQFKS